MYMTIDQHIEAFIEAAESKALATYGTEINVVPVSSVKVVNGNIWLINYFFDKTLANIVTNTSVSLVCWKQMMGYQIKGTVAYKTEGDEFDAAVQWIKEILPERIVKGLLIVTPTYIYDISPTKDTKEKFLNE
jgi:predicted pyridoxine 5'-phosphate oxidase superfamily flavin-nucleotide-binding protein